MLFEFDESICIIAVRTFASVSTEYGKGKQKPKGNIQKLSNTNTTIRIPPCHSALLSSPCLIPYLQQSSDHHPSPLL